MYFMIKINHEQMSKAFKKRRICKTLIKKT